jgi:general secretion pathway protein L
MFETFLRWWATQLLSLVPPGLGALAGRWRTRLIADLQGPALTLTLQRHGRTTALGRFTLDPAGTGAMRAALAGRRPPAMAVLRLPPEMLLEQRVTLPLAAEWTIERVLLHEIERVTPFATADLFWTWSVERRNDALGRLQVCLSLVPKASVSAAIAAMRQAGAPLSVLEAELPGGVPRRMPLREAGPRSWGGRRFALACSLCATLAVIAVAIPFVDQSLAAQRYEDRLTYLRPGMRQVETLRQRITGAETGASALSTLHQRVGDTLGMLATLTRVLPDDTYLKDLSIRAGVATFAGQSLAAAHLISVLDSDPAIRNPGFTAPITRSEISGNIESFSVRLEFAR